MGSLVLDVLAVVMAVQAAQATVTGTVRDEGTGSPLAGALVVLTDLGRSAVTDPAGRYRLDQVPAGPQHLAFRYIGHAQRALHALVPPDGQLQINVSLRAEPVHLGTIEVRTPLALRGLEHDHGTPFPDRRSSILAVRNHPLLAEPDVLQALGGGSVVLRPESPSGVHVRGGASDQTAYQLDGIPVFSPYHAAGLFSAWNPDALSEVALFSVTPAPEGPAALGGTVSAATRTPGSRLRAEGSVGTTQARMTVDGPLGQGGAGYLLSFRTGFPGTPFPDADASYLGAESGDRLAKVEVPAFGGRVRLLAYDSENEIDAAAHIAGEDAGPTRHTFAWNSASFGLEWRRSLGAITTRMVGWHATMDASSRWAATRGGVLGAERRDLGMLVTAERQDGDVTTLAGIRIERSRTEVAVQPASGVGRPWVLRATTPVVAGFARQQRPLSDRWDLTLAASVTAADRRVHLGPQALVRWRLDPRLALTAGYARHHQFAQSLRNSESVVGNVFPADLFIGAGAPGVPTARSDQAHLAAELHPAAGLRIGVEAYRRVSSGLLLVAPREGGPFTTDGFVVGSGTAAGLALDASLSSARFGALASYGLQRVRLTYPGADYVPEYGMRHLLEAGVIAFPTVTTSVRIGATGALGRRTTAVLGDFEWEACNLLDRGCEFGGSPDHSGAPLGDAVLPGYFRIDLGVRKHWHLEIAGRDAMVAVFGTLTNLLNRRNLLTYARDPATGERIPITMRPLAPLLIGIDWRF